MICRVPLLVAVLVATAHADTPVDVPESIEVDRDAPPAGRVEFGFDGGAPVGEWAAGVQLGWLDRPIAFRTATRETHPVARRETVALGGAFSLGPSFVIDGRLPLAHQVGDRLHGLGDDRALDRWVTGDLGVGGRLRVVARDSVSAFVRGQLTLPTGNERQFAGEPSWTAAWMLIGRVSLPYGIVAAATGGIRLRGAEVKVGDRLVGDELSGGVGVSAPIPPIAQLWCVADQVKVAAELVGVLGDSVAGQHSPSPAEARIGVVTRPRPELALGVHIGTGLDDQIGSPRFRAMVELVWQGPEPAPAAPAIEGDVIDE
jgi:hypothetical protein